MCDCEIVIKHTVIIKRRLLLEVAFELLNQVVLSSDPRVEDNTENKHYTFS